MPQGRNVFLPGQAKGRALKIAYGGHDGISGNKANIRTAYDSLRDEQ
jgi:hypothetical protein